MHQEGKSKRLKTCYKYDQNDSKRHHDNCQVEDEHVPHSAGTQRFHALTLWIWTYREKSTAAGAKEEN